VVRVSAVVTVVFTPTAGRREDSLNFHDAWVDLRFGDR
jgi:hypothetical protein